VYIAKFHAMADLERGVGGDRRNQRKIMKSGFPFAIIKKLEDISFQARSRNILGSDIEPCCFSFGITCKLDVHKKTTFPSPLNVGKHCVFRLKTDGKSVTHKASVALIEKLHVKNRCRFFCSGSFFLKIKQKLQAGFRPFLVSQTCFAQSLALYVEHRYVVSVIPF
jgi:hypothetical protein